MKAHSRGAAEAAAIEFFTHPALPHAGLKASMYLLPKYSLKASKLLQPADMSLSCPNSFERIIGTEIHARFLASLR